MLHLVTGGSGFLGDIIARRLLERGERVRILDIWKDARLSREVEFVECDIRNRSGVAKAMKDVDIVHHTAAVVPLTKSGTKFWEVNVTGSQIAAEEAVKARVQGFVHMSSSAIFGCPEHSPIHNDTPAMPVEIYGRAKLAGEKVVRDTCGRSQMPLVVIRPRTILSEGRLGIFQILFEWVFRGKNVYVIGSGDNLFQFVHAHDLMDAYMLVLEKEGTGVYNVGTDRFGALRQVLEKLIIHAGSASKVKSLPERLTINTLSLLDWMRLCPLAPYHYLTYHKPYCFDVSPLLELGWNPRYSNDEMFCESYDWFISHYDTLVAEEKNSPNRHPVREKILALVRLFS